MSRPIKYQAYDCKTNEIITWDEINEVDELGFLPFVDMLRTPERYKMRQFTGLHDRNGKEIYEGDIGEGENAIYLIEWNAVKAQYQAKIIKTKSVLTKHCSFPLWQYVEDDGKCRFKVIGTVWEHPHLLKGEEADDIGRVFRQIEEIQGDWDGKCSCTECYWNMYHPTKCPDRNECVSESLADTKMTPNSTECPSYWSYATACGRPKGGVVEDAEV